MGVCDELGHAVEDIRVFLAWEARHLSVKVSRFATDTRRLHPLMIGYATNGVVVLAVPLPAGRWHARRATSISVRTRWRPQLSAGSFASPAVPAQVQAWAPEVPAGGGFR